MADFTLNAPGTTQNPYTNSAILVVENSMRSDSNGIRAVGDVYTVCAHNVNYGLVITSTVTLGTFDTLGDQFYVGAVVRTGANAGGFIGCRFGLNTGAVLLTATPTGTNNNISAGATVPASTIGDVLGCVVTLNGTNASLTASYNGSPITFTGGSTTTTYATEPTLSAGWVMDPEDVDGSYITQFTGTGVAGGGGVTFVPNTPSGAIIFMGSYSY